MRSNGHLFQYSLRTALRAVLMLVVLSTALGCRRGSEEGAAEAVGAAQAPTHTSVPAQATAEKSAASVAESALPPPAASEGPKPAAAALIGQTMPPYPEGLVEAQGVCVSGGEGLERVCDFGIAVLGRENGEYTSSMYLVASRNADPDASRPEWNITDAIDAPVAKEGYDLQLGACRVDGEMRGDIVALVRHSEEQEYSSDIAWKKSHDAKSGKFADIDRGRVDCVNPGYGL
jgi:hypothetical protein